MMASPTPMVRIDGPIWLHDTVGIRHERPGDPGRALAVHGRAKSSTENSLRCRAVPRSTASRSFRRHGRRRSPRTRRCRRRRCKASSTRLQGEPERVAHHTHRSGSATTRGAGLEEGVAAHAGAVRVDVEDLARGESSRWAKTTSGRSCRRRRGPGRRGWSPRCQRTACGPASRARCRPCGMVVRCRRPRRREVEGRLLVLKLGRGIGCRQSASRGGRTLLSPGRGLRGAHPFWLPCTDKRCRWWRSPDRCRCRPDRGRPRS